jgi:soluble lytic murein transglycosylase
MSEADAQHMSKKQKTTLIVLTIVAVFLILAILAGIFAVRSRFRLKYPELIRKYSAEYGLDPTYVAGVIYTESKFRERAVSRVGARGLMQIMPKTGAEIAQALGERLDPEDPEDLERLFDPETSIRYGCYYLRQQLDRFDQNAAVTLAAYNAGPEKATKWLKEYGLDDDGRIKYIPYPETSNYVTRVFGAQKIYAFLYTKELTEKTED